ncbi:AsmA family protein [Gluconacetobacter azotocaptans]|uniref:AsmA family protein n=1 Tax=Gluconacetobacter azotocaptans TaxID=142834 RepID=A0A7W4JUJ3_9PROT|nr:AsmA family protein [Gluconacetobacter azotocaptans]MBB2191109.1 AsmA family protein [Gluconacetobacter azotocaptans]MBM9402280.1 AsmA family protein [Gluconacetobacter azotocaptans]GBQ33173.1 lipopolysaccharide biogenesis periplasmic protein AsmA [Gluconacetobacter azotocaptans DSM 13594]
MADAHPSPRFRTGRILGVGLGALLLLGVLIVLLWSWDWFVPMVNSRASAALGRPTTISHLHVRLGRVVTATVDDLTIAQPKGFEDEKQPFATARHASVSFDVWRYIRHRAVTLPLVAFDAPRLDVVRRADGSTNAVFGASKGSGGSPALPDIGELRITDGQARIADARLRADMMLAVHTTPPHDGERGQIVADARGRYAAQPIDGHFVGGALLTLLDTAHPYPVDLTVHNGPTLATLKGSIVNPLKFEGAQLSLHFSGPDMSLLYPLTGIPIPRTPDYSITGTLDYDRKTIRFGNLRGKMGSSDLDGTITVDPQPAVPFVQANLHSRRVDLVDLGGFIGANPDKTPTAAEKKAAEADPNVLPDTPINIPKLRAINAHLLYRGDHIENRRTPLDNIDADIAIQDGAIDVRRLNFAVGSGTLASVITLTPTDGGFATRMRMDFAHIDLSRIMQAATGSGAKGIIGGHATLQATGNSVASLLARGNGGLTLVLDQGGDISALVPDVLGLQIGNAVLSALGFPKRTDVQCFIADLPLRDGVVSTRTLLLETGEGRTLGRGTIDLRRNTIDYALTTRSVHFSVASLPGPFHITGPLKSPSVLPGAEIVGRAAAAAGLGFLMPPLALLPTIQFGVGDSSICARAVRAANENPAAGIAPGALSHPRGGRRPAAPRAAPAPAPNQPRGARKIDPDHIRAVWEARQRQGR